MLLHVAVALHSEPLPLPAHLCLFLPLYLPPPSAFFFSIAQQLHVPTHIYSELCQLHEGAKRVQPHVAGLVAAIRSYNSTMFDANASHDILKVRPRRRRSASGRALAPPPCRRNADAACACHHRFQLKAAIWAVCHIASSSCGFALLPADICSVIARIAERSPLLSLRGSRCRSI